MLKNKVLMLIATITLSTASFTVVPVHAQSVYQSIPKAYRGTWKLKKSLYGSSKKNEKLKITKRSIKGTVVNYHGKNLGVRRAKKSINVFQINKGKRVGESFILVKTHYKRHVALKTMFDTAIQYYIK